MHEIDVSLTDFGLAILCAFFAARLLKTNTRGRLALYWIIIFLSIGAGALLGAIGHGFFPNSTSLSYRLLWAGIFLSIGLTGLGVWNIAANFLSLNARKWLFTLSVILFLVYLLTVTFVSQDFAVVVFYYLPPIIFLTICFAVGAFNKEWADFSKIGLAGSVTTLIAASTQQLKVSIHPKYFDHNALYHLIQAIGLALLFVSATRQLKKER